MVRHPLYLGSSILAGGFALMATSGRHWFSSLLLWSALSATFRWLYAAKINMEEKDLRERFAADFERYRAEVPPVWPTWAGLKKAWRTSSFSWSQVLHNREHRTVLAVLALAALLRFKMVYRL